MPRVLIVEDDAAMRDMVGYALVEEGMEVEAVADGESALEIFFSSGPFDLVILDVMLPGIDGISVCKELTSASDVPVVMLTARDDETSVVVGLEVGADDYITKPFSHRELVSRVRATLRRRRIDARASSKQERLEFPGLAIDLARRQVVAQGTPVDLTAAQFDILLLLASHPGWVYGRGQIMETVWGTEFSGDSRAADMQISNIREKIESDPKNPRYVLTVRGVGYKFTEV
ncbi:MAG TPA: response regulator transcription factor [Rubrobacter sp.]|nr:response regulator transcription factor [Rubrobacter sp.]